MLPNKKSSELDNDCYLKNTPVCESDNVLEDGHDSQAQESIQTRQPEDANSWLQKRK